jgi:hypothetical protein
MSPINKTDRDQISMTIASAMSQGFAQLTAVLSQPVAASKAATAKTSYRYSGFIAKGGKADPADLAAKDQRILNAFTRKGFKDVVLMDRNDSSKSFNVRPFKAWVDQGYVPRKGSKSVAGLFHISQCDKLPGKASPSPKKGKPTLRPVS